MRFLPPISQELLRMKTVCLWSEPRNISTALMYRFAEPLIPKWFWYDKLYDRAIRASFGE